MKEIWLVSKVTLPDYHYQEVGYIEGTEEDVARWCETHCSTLSENEEYSYMSLTNLLEE